MRRSRLPVGKLPPALLRELISPRTPLPPEVLLGPRVGEDACAIAVSKGTLVAATDPITLTGTDVGAHAVVINANDVAAMGVRPRWFLATVLLPSGTFEEDVRELFEATHRAAREAGVALVGGHTEVTEAVRQPVVVGQMLGLAENGRTVPTGGVEPGHAVVQIGAAPVEGAAVLAVEVADRLASLGAAVVSRARDAVRAPGISIVEPALAAAQRGASALHDPTEGGLAMGLYELAEASGVGLAIDASAVLWFDAGRAVCAAVGADPWGTLASGTLLAAFPRGLVGEALEALQAQGWRCAQIGWAEAGEGVRADSGGAVPRFERDEVARVLGG